MNGELLRLERITRSFPGVLALDGVSLDVRAGEVHGLVGENGAGKSTLISVLAGSLSPDSGRVFLGGKEIHIDSPHHAHTLGIRVVFQHLSLAPNLTVAENLFMGRELSSAGLLSRRQMDELARDAMERLGEALDPRERVRDLSVPQRYLVEIAKATLDDLSILAFDEPTASLTTRETKRLFELVDRLVKQGKGVIWVTHRLEELQAIADRITVMRDGRYVTTVPADSVDQNQLITYMTGKQFQEVFPPLHQQPDASVQPVVAVRGLSTKSGLRDVTLTLRPGEILGIGGLIGSGKAELGRALYGLETITAGEVNYFGTTRAPKSLSPSALTSSGVMYFPADRWGEGVVLCRPVGENMTLSALPQFERLGFLDKRREGATVRQLIEQLDIHPATPEPRIRTLSGGNQQKALIARGLVRDSRIFILDEPTQGIDIGAKVRIYQLIQSLAQAGAAILLISSDLHELLHLCHRVITMHQGKVSAVVAHEEASEERLLRHYFGETEEGVDEHAG